MDDWRKYNIQNSYNTLNFINIFRNNNNQNENK